MGAGVDGVQQPLRRARAQLPRAGPDSRGAAAAARGADEPGSVRHRAALAGRQPPAAEAEGQKQRGWVGPRGRGAGAGRGAEAGPEPPARAEDAHPASAGRAGEGLA